MAVCADKERLENGTGDRIREPYNLSIRSSSCPICRLDVLLHLREFLRHLFESDDEIRRRAFAWVVKGIITALTHFLRLHLEVLNPNLSDLFHEETVFVDPILLLGCSVDGSLGIVVHIARTGKSRLTIISGLIFTLIGLTAHHSDAVAMRAFLISFLAIATTSASPNGRHQTNSQDLNIPLANESIPGIYDRAVRSTLAKRWDGSPAMGGELQKARNKGCTLLAQMHTDDVKAGQFFLPPRDSAHSDYLELSDLTDWGYFTKKTAINQPKCDMGNVKNGYGLEAVLKAKGFSADKKEWKCVKITHGEPEGKTMPLDLQSYNTPNGRVLRSTGALYQFALNEKDGILVIAKQYSPAHQAQYRRPPVPADQFPDLRSSSDIAWLAWKPLHDKGVKLNHIVTWSVTNGASSRLIAAALDALADETETTLDTDLKPYPWKEFDTGRPSGQLVLGSPNGLGIGYMLVQHKPEIGNKRTKKIDLFLADTVTSGLREPSLWWALEDSLDDKEIPME